MPSLTGRAFWSIFPHYFQHSILHHVLYHCNFTLWFFAESPLLPDSVYSSEHFNINKGDISRLQDNERTNCPSCIDLTIFKLKSTKSLLFFFYCPKVISNLLSWVQRSVKTPKSRFMKKRKAES